MPACEAATLTVGPGQTYTTIASAIAASHDGDVINVFAGVYVNDYAEIRSKITLAAVNGRVTMTSNTFIPNGKAILITDTDVAITGFTFTNARVTQADGGNGAGIRYQGGKLQLTDCYFHNNQEGLLAASDPNGSITITTSEFYHNGTSSGVSAGYTHNLYVNNVALLDIERSYLHGAFVGHEIKSRAQKTIVNASRIADGATGTSSYSIDLPNGGVGLITNNEIEQGPLGENPIIITFGEEGGVYDGSSLTVIGNLIENDLASSSALAVRNVSTVTAVITKTRVFGLTTGQMASGPATVTGTTILLKEPVIANVHPWPASGV